MSFPFCSEGDWTGQGGSALVFYFTINILAIKLSTMFHLKFAEEQNICNRCKRGSIADSLIEGR